jgi:hypothetical protein
MTGPYWPSTPGPEHDTADEGAPEYAAEAPDHDVDLVLEQLRAARAELVDAGRTVHMLAVNAEDLAGHQLRWQLIEAVTAERRCELWAAAIARLEDEARALGVDPGVVL